MRAGKLDRTITIQRAAETVAASGAVSSAWSDLATVRAAIVQSSAVEFIRAYGEAEETGTVFRIRYVAGLTLNDRVVLDGQAFNLVEMKEIGRRRGLELRCERVRT
ncbi:phage head closure protein [Mesorhizobium marinum]|uniref:phage head closure protein n=1 Tax=Mesorhizobium marinum TaxID=3228790 RepID=UPI003467E9C6